MSFWTDFETELSKVAVLLKTEVAATVQYFKPKVEAGAEEVASIAIQAVLAQAPLLISGKEKLSAATSNVISTVATNGKTIAIDIAETAVQAAVNKLTPKAS